MVNYPSVAEVVYPGLEVPVKPVPAGEGIMLVELFGGCAPALSNLGLELGLDTALTLVYPE